MTTAGDMLVFAQPIPARIIGGEAMVAPVCGWLDGGDATVERVIVEVDGRPAGELRIGEPVSPRLWPAANARTMVNGIGFSGNIGLPARPPGFRHTVTCTLTTRERSRWQTSVIPIERVAMDKADPAARGQRPRIAVCMAVYNPSEPAFRRQVRSIAAQSRADWICIVSDDGSDAAHRELIHRVIGGDDRFHYFRNQTNLGFYGNFEAALARVPASVEFVALADQDDEWYPDKLDQLAGAFGDGVQLVYSDMRIVDRDGGLLAPSYWGYRKNAWQDLFLMLVANTVTGAACMMRRELVDFLLPFPPRVGDAFHDHWIACAALSRGRIAYLDRPLYDYYQYSDSIIGHCGFDAGGSASRRDSIEAWQLLNPINLRSFAGRFVGAGLAVYWHECRRIESICSNLLYRGVEDAGKRAVLAAWGRGLRSVRMLLRRNLTRWDSARLTDNAERRLAHGYLVHSALLATGYSPRRGTG